MTSPIFDPPRERVVIKQVAKSGIGIGSALAIAISWSINKSLVWAIIHGIFGWFYVVFYALTRNKP